MTDPDEHPYPNGATIKELYACAFRCAEPDCRKPLYRLNNDTGDRILNSRVAHIHARRKGGPRWKSMSSAENRAPSNLILLCIEHSYEVDEFPDQYPAELLIAWKARQIAEYEEIQHAWPLNDSEVAEIVAESFDERRVGIARAGANSVLAVARSVGLLTACARRERHGPLAEIAAWERTWQRVRAQAIGWDSETGEALYAEPSRVETDAHAQRVQAALATASDALAPLVDAVHAEVSAVAAADPTLLPWCAWINTTVDQVFRSAQEWPKPPPFADNGELEAALGGLRRATDALTGKWRGETAEDPPEPEPEHAEPAESDAERWLREHKELLDKARPHASVEHLQFNAALYDQVRASLQTAANIPPTMMFISVDLFATARLAAAIARNADDTTFQMLIADAAEQTPLAAAIALLSGLATFAEKAGRTSLEQEAQAAARALVVEESWRDRGVWEANTTYGRAVLSMAAGLSSANEVAAKLASTLTADPGLLDVFLAACAQWSERRDSHDWTVTGLDRTYEDLPRWFPTSTVVTEIRRQLPEITPALARNAESIGHETTRLAACVLYLAAEADGDAI